MESEQGQRKPFSQDEIAQMYSLAVNVHREITFSRTTTVTRAIAYQLTEFVASLCVELANDLEASTGAFFNSRGIIEDMALLLYFEKKDEDSTEAKVFKMMPAIMEYPHFLRGRCPNDENIKAVLPGAKAKYGNALIDVCKWTGRSKEEVDSLFRRAELPFTLDESLTYARFIRQNIPQEAYSVIDYLYSNASQQIHPTGSKAFYPATQSLPFLILPAFSGLFHQVFDRYANPSLLYPMMDEKRMGSDKRFFERAPFYNDAKRKWLMLESLANALDQVFKHGDDAPSTPCASLLRDLSVYKRDLAMDQLNDLGFEMGMKFKILVERVASYWEYDADLAQGNVSLLKMNLYQVSSGYKELQTLVDFSDQSEGAHARFIQEMDLFLIPNYDHFKKDYPDTKVTMKQFRKTVLGQTLGWTINGEGKCLSLTQLVSNYLGRKDYVLSSDPTVDEGIRNMIAIFYEESQMSSHGNGYLFFGGTGLPHKPEARSEVGDAMILSILVKWTYLWSTCQNLNPQAKRLYDSFLSASKNYMAPKLEGKA
jgi:hypothetical protein